MAAPVRFAARTRVVGLIVVIVGDTHWFGRGRSDEHDTVVWRGPRHVNSPTAPLVNPIVTRTPTRLTPRPGENNRTVFRRPRIIKCDLSAHIVINYETPAGTTGPAGYIAQWHAIIATPTLHGYIIRYYMLYDVLYYSHSRSMKWHVCTYRSILYRII